MFGEQYTFQDHPMINSDLNYQKNISFQNGLNNLSSLLLEKQKLSNLIVYFLFRKWQSKSTILYKLIALILKIAQRASPKDRMLSLQKRHIITHHKRFKLV